MSHCVSVEHVPVVLVVHCAQLERRELLLDLLNDALLDFPSEQVHQSVKIRVVHGHCEVDFEKRKHPILQRLRLRVCC